MQDFNWRRLLGRRQRHSELERQLAAIHQSFAVIEFDLQGHVLHANASFLATMGYKQDEVLHQHHRMFVNEAMVHSPAYADFWRQLSEGQPQTGRFPRLGKNGHEIWLQACYSPVYDSHGKPYQVVKYATDITEQQRQNADAQGQLAAISKVQAIIEFNLDGTILDANALFLQAVGYRLDEIVGQHHRMFVQPHETQSPAYRQFWQKLAAGQHDAGQYLRIGKHGRQIWIDASYNPILDASGRPFKVVKYATDITRRFTASQTLRVAVQGLAGSAQQTRQASSLSQDACRVAEDGGQTMREVMATMDSISAGSRKISDITGVIDSIAFQTNILALNAAVEAARAGEQGRGFAVVASEVRALAQHSASAAKEIKQLIQSSSEQIARGSQQMHKAGGTMEDIVASSRQVNTILGDVANSAMTQSAQLREVSEVLSCDALEAEAMTSASAAESLVSSRPALTVVSSPSAPQAAPQAAGTPLYRVA